MVRTGRVLLALVLCGGLLLALAPAASAAGDTCINLGGFTFVGRLVREPARGLCTTWTGFVPQGCENASDAYTSGNLCGSSNNQTVHGNLTSSCDDGLTVVVDNFTYTKATGEGSGVRYVLTGGFHFPVSATKIKPPCARIPIPIPAAVESGGGLARPAP